MAYGQAELQQMAVVSLAARDRGDERYLILVISICLRTGLNSEQVEQGIENFARCNACKQI